MGRPACSHGIRVSDLGVPVDGKAISNCSDQVSMYVSDHDPLIDRIARVLAGGTSRRIVLGAVASAAVGFVRGPIPGSLAKANIGQTVRYFALGDSVASGHGLLDNDGSACVPNGVSCCHRSRLAYPWIVSELLTDLGYEVVFADGQHLACSSARSEHLNGQIDILLDQLDGRSPEDAVLLSITIGVNDFAWDSPAIIPHFVESDRRFTEWVDGVIEPAVIQIGAGLDRLLANVPDARVVLTAYHNPLNRSSFVFTAMGCGSLPTRMSCYERTEYALTSLNDALSALVLSKADTQKIAFTPGLHEAFHADGGHEAPGLGGGVLGGIGLCGFSGPGIRDTWIQYPGDPESNSVFAMAGVPNLGGAGDCFHPNRRGARAFAEAVVQAALETLPAATTRRSRAETASLRRAS